MSSESTTVGVTPLTEAYWPADISEPVLETTVGALLREAASLRPTELALIAGDASDERRRWTCAELLSDAEFVAQALLARFEPGEHIAVWAPGIPEWVLLEFGAALAGLVLVTVNPAYKPSELAYVLKQSRAAGIFLVKEFRGNQMASSLNEVRKDLPNLRATVYFDEWGAFISERSSKPLPDVTPDDPAQIQYTSGTTGFPKGALLHHRGITNNARLFAQRFEVSVGDVWINPMPLFHTAGCVMATLGALQLGASQVVVPAFDPALVLELIESERANRIIAVPTMLIAMMEHPDFSGRDLSSLRSVVSGGATVPPPLVRSIEEALGARFAIVFGQTEASPIITQTSLDDVFDDRANTLGRPLPQAEVKIVEPRTGDTASPNEIGEICVRGYQVMAGYFDLSEATAEAIDPDGWLHTGDLASMDERGYCRIEGRLKDMIIRGGENIYPREIEELLFAHPAVAEVSVVGIPDEKWGEVVAAFVRPAPGQQAIDEDLRAYCRLHLAPYKTPVHWIIVDAFPMTASGKIQKFALRDTFLARGSA